MKCKDCKWWKGELLEDGVGSGVCHRNAPHPKFFNGELTGELEYNPDYFYIEWPDTMSDAWCGEFEKRKKKQ